MGAVCREDPNSNRKLHGEDDDDDVVYDVVVVVVVVLVGNQVFGVVSRGSLFWVVDRTCERSARDGDFQHT